MKRKLKDVAVRSAKTFVQAFVSAVSVGQLLEAANMVEAKEALYVMLVAGGSAGVSAVWNMITVYFKKEEAENE